MEANKKMIKKYELLGKMVVMIMIILFSSKMIASTTDEEVNQQEIRVEKPEVDKGSENETEILEK